MFSTGIALLALVPALIVYLYLLVLRKRNEVDGLPSAPMTKGKLWGHLPLAGDLVKRFPKSHYHAHIRYLQTKYNCGGIFYNDLWPIGPRFVYISDPKLLAQLAVESPVVPKSHFETDYLAKLLGPKSLFQTTGKEWKSFRGIYNPGFSNANVMTLVPYIVDLVGTFRQQLAEKAEDNQLFRLEVPATNLTVDVIGKVVLDVDFNTMNGANAITQTLLKRVDLYPASTSPWPWDNLDPFRAIKGWLNLRKLDRLIGVEVDKRLNHIDESINDGTSSRSTPSKDNKKSIIDLSVEAYYKHKAEVKAGNMDDVILRTFRASMIDNIKAFIFAGHDTTASTIAYCFYFMQLRPAKFKQFLNEIDQVFGKGATFHDRVDKIKKDPFILNKLEYCNAIAKEVLRIFPPVSAIGQIHANDPDHPHFITDPETGTKYPLDGWHIWRMSYLTGREEEYFPEPLEFIPERFIPSRTPFPTTKLFTTEGKEAWRPFERGPRGCIGQELAMLELKTVMALVMGDFVFQAEYDGVKVGPEWKPIESSDEKPEMETPDTIEGHLCYQDLRFTAKPRDGMPGRIYWREDYDLQNGG